jgi:hypothetical protein
VQEEGHQLLNVTFAQGAALQENSAYLDGCSTITVFKTDKYLKGIKTLTALGLLADLKETREVLSASGVEVTSITR